MPDFPPLKAACLIALTFAFVAAVAAGASPLVSGSIAVAILTVAAVPDFPTRRSRSRRSKRGDRL
jgi:hypothetical protein